jgi:hypothetical protein
MRVTKTDRIVLLGVAGLMLLGMLAGILGGGRQTTDDTVVRADLSSCRIDSIGRGRAIVTFNNASDEDRLGVVSVVFLNGETVVGKGTATIWDVPARGSAADELSVPIAGETVSRCRLGG